MTKIKKLSIIFVTLLFISIGLSWFGRQERVSSVNKSLFSVADTTQIEAIVIAAQTDTIRVRREADQWQLNQQFKADPQLIYLIQRILGAVEVQRPVSQSNLNVIKSELVKRAKFVTIAMKNGDTRKFYAGGNASKTMAYFGDEDLSDIYIVAIPGYKSYLSGIFELTLGQWRDRVLFASSWRTLQLLQIDYLNPDQSDLTIAFENKFLAVEGVSVLDTARLMNYLQPLEYFQLNDYLEPGSFPRYDSIMTTDPLAVLSVKDIDSSKDQMLTIFPRIPGENFHLLTNQEGEMLVVDQQRMKNLLTGPSSFLGN